MARFAGRTIHAVGGIAVRKGTRPKVAVVQRSKDKLWVLPRGKLRRDERPIAGARREVVEETGFRVKVYAFLGVITYRARGRPKVVQFWFMRAEAQPSYEVMKDIIAVEWLSLAAAVKRLSYPLEKLFLANVGRHAILQHRRLQRGKAKTLTTRTGRRQKNPTHRRGV
jgi:8-oxo-dGTP diphosphatase